MSFRPDIIAFDYETSSLNYWESDFEVISAAFAWRSQNGEIKTLMTQSRGEISALLQRARAAEIPLVCHNAAFEYGVTKYQFPGNEDVIQVDTMRLVQLYDGGGKNNEFGLAASVKRILPNEPDHKAIAYEWIRNNIGAKAGSEGQFISALPKDRLADYNIADAVVTLKLYEHITSFFTKINFNWKLDHSLYLSTVRYLNPSRAKGVKVNRPELASYIGETEAELYDTDAAFKEKFKTEISRIENENKERWINSVKRDVNRQKRAELIDQNRDKWQFNVGSRHHLKRLFVDILGIQPTFKTPKGHPSFKAAHLHTYGDGGKMLSKRNKRKFVKGQSESLLGLSGRDGRWHIDIKPTGTKTGRLAGGDIDE